jgi:hypothetical protein
MFDADPTIRLICGMNSGDLIEIQKHANAKRLAPKRCRRYYPN